MADADRKNQTEFPKHWNVKNRKAAWNDWNGLNVWNSRK
jgi:hypothetical protein